MWIERQRVGAFDTTEHVARIVAELEERSVRTVHMVPQIGGGTQVRNGVQRIDSAGVGCSGARDHHEGCQPRGAIRRDCVTQRGERHAIVRIARNGALDGPIYFGLSGRMTKRAGRTAKFVTPPNSVHYEITISVSLLFDAFRGNDREVAVVGQVCENRLQALQRVFEHEMVHLGEFLCWSASDCAAERFQGIASRFFRHRTHTHSLITRRERAAESGIQRGPLVTFEFEGRRLTGRVNRVTKRATVLVPDANGQKYSDGFLYKKYYVPLSTLKPVEVRAAGA